VTRPKLPYMPWYPVDYDADDLVQDLSELADLFYRRLLDLQWRRRGRGIPPSVVTDGGIVRYNARCNDRYDVRWGDLWSEVAQFFEFVENEDGEQCFRNVRLHNEWLEHQEKYQKRLAASAKAVAARKQKPNVAPCVAPDVERRVQPTHNSELRTHHPEHTSGARVRASVDGGAEESDPDSDPEADAIADQKGAVWLRLTTHPWGFRKPEKLAAIIARGTTPEDLDAYERQSPKHGGMAWARAKIQDFARPGDIPRSGRRSAPANDDGGW